MAGGHEMGTTEIIEEQVKKYGGQHAEEIIQFVKELAEIDVRIKQDMDNIERFDSELISKHDELADRINDLVGKVSNNNSDSNSFDSEADREHDEHDMIIKLEIRVTRQSYNEF